MLRLLVLLGLAVVVESGTLVPGYLRARYNRNGFYDNPVLIPGPVTRGYGGGGFTVGSGLMMDESGVFGRGSRRPFGAPMGASIFRRGRRGSWGGPPPFLPPAISLLDYGPYPNYGRRQPYYQPLPIYQNEMEEPILLDDGEDDLLYF